MKGKFTDEQIAQIEEIVAQAIAAANSCKCNAITDEECSDKAVAPRPLGVWCLTENYRAIQPTEWEKQNNGEQCIGIGVVTEETAYIVSLEPSPSLPLGSPKVTEYPDICYDKETFDNEAVTEAFLEAQTSCEEDVFYWADDKRYPYRDCPAINNLPAPIMSSFGTISWVLPTLATMKDMSERIGDINAAIFAVGGIVLSPYYHWTCTVNRNSKNSPFVVDSDDGNVTTTICTAMTMYARFPLFILKILTFNFWKDMDKDLKLTLADDGIIVEVEGKKLKVSYKQEELPFVEARNWCKENGGGDESVENLRLVAKYRDKINEQLTAAGKGEIFGWYWSNEESWRYDDCAFVVNSSNGYVDYYYMNLNYYVRAVTAL